MKRPKTDELLRILNEANDWMSAESLARLIGVSQRTIRNYINQIILEQAAEIESSKSGYRLKKIIPSSYDKEQLMDERSYFIISKLLSSPEGVSVFHLSESLMVSESTVLNNLIPKIKKIILPFNLSIHSHNYAFYLSGSEQNKRKMIGHLVTHNNYGYFTSEDTLEKIFPSFDIKNVMNSLYTLCDNSKLFINNFSMNNLLIHILIILIRVNSNEELKSFEKNDDVAELLSKFPQKNEIIQLAGTISCYFQEHFDIKIPEKDSQQILLLIFLSTNYDSGSLNSIIDSAFTASVKDMVNHVSKKYYISEFNQEFISQLTLHMYNAKERSQFNLSYPNPIAEQIKSEYAPIYDMAVYFSHIFSKKYNITLSESEIAFITFHFGAYLENNQNHQSAFTCIIIVEDYLNFQKNIVQQIEKNFRNELIIRQVMSSIQYWVLKPDCDLLISTLDIPLNHPHTIIINPIVTKKNLGSIRDTLDLLVENKKIEKARKFLKSWFHSELYFRNVKLDSPTSYINFMGQECMKLGFIQSSFISDVLLRESISSTAFTNYVAIPHTISQNADHSFICVVHNDSPIPWTNNKANFLLMIGITQDDMKYFHDAFNLLIELFLTPAVLSKLLNTKNFQEFVNTALQINGLDIN